MLTGRCHCGAITYEITGEVMRHALCHCADCRRHAGAPMVGWAITNAEDIRISGTPRTYASSEHGRRQFCGACGTSLFYVNEQILPGVVDVQSATLDDPDQLPAQLHVQIADRIAWMTTAHELPMFERYPG